ncbi:hypothetical protein BC829DRAFT_379023 [Chytridium lagenaria]|nr:hypothetical protein BC829DRAFT_379023 [Chytridium lagenaria]
MASIRNWLWKKVKITERHVLVSWLYYSIPAYVFYLVGYFTFFNPHGEILNLWLLKTVPLLVFPFLIYYGRKFIFAWFKAKKKIEEQQLETLRTQQKQKVEELKKKTGYYTTKGLIERYESPSKADPNRLQVPGTPGTGTPNPLTAPGSGQLRQRYASVPIPPTAAILENSLSAPVLGTPGSGTRNWYDKVVDAIIGDEGPQQKYALICQQCFEHNGLVLPDEYGTAKFRCMKCGFFNARKSRLGNASAPSSSADVSPPPSPSPSMDRRPSHASLQSRNPDSRSSSREPLLRQHEAPMASAAAEAGFHNEIQDGVPAATPEPSIEHLATEPYSIGHEQDKVVAGREGEDDRAH